MRFLMATTLLFFAISTALASKIQIPESATAEIHKINSSVDALEYHDVAVGDLDADGLDDVAVVVGYKKDNTNLERLIVLSGTKEHKYIFSTQSAAWRANMRRTIDLSIKKSSIFITGKGSTDLTYLGTTYQFKKIDGSFIMIGVTNTTGTINSDDKREESYNLLNNKAVTVVIEDGKREEFKDRLSGVYKIKLDEFSFDNEVEFK